MMVISLQILQTALNIGDLVTVSLKTVSTVMPQASQCINVNTS